MRPHSCADARLSPPPSLPPRASSRRCPQPSHKTFKIKKHLAKKAKQNRPIPHWIRFRTDNKIRCVSFRLGGGANHAPPGLREPVAPQRSRRSLRRDVSRNGGSARVVEVAL